MNSAPESANPAVAKAKWLVLVSCASYVVASSILLVLGTWGILRLNDGLFPLLWIGGEDQLAIYLWIVLWPMATIAILPLAQLASMPWVIHAVRGTGATRRSEQLALSACRFLAALLGLAFGGAAFELLLTLNAASDLAGIFLLAVGASLAVLAVTRWAHWRTKRLSTSPRQVLVAEHFGKLSILGLAALALAGILHFADQVLGPFHLGVVGRCTLLFGMQTPALRLAFGAELCPAYETNVTSSAPMGHFKCSFQEPREPVPQGQHTSSEKPYESTL